MVAKSLFILNKAGGLIYHRDFQEDVQKLGDSNDYLVIAGTFHSVHALTSRISPNGGKSSGLLVMEMGDSALHCFQTLTGVKILILTELNQLNIDTLSNQVYRLYADYVMKNPFYTLDMPIRCAKFDRELVKYMETVV